MLTANNFRCGRLALLLLSALLVLGSCSKSESDTSSALFINFGPGEGFSYRTATNFPTGTQDPTDWKLDGTWNTREQALFQTLGFDLNSTPQGQSRPSQIGCAGYPNPAVSQFNFFYTAPDVVSCKFVLVDAVYHVLTQNSTYAPSKQSTFAFDGDALGLKRGQRYRVYYVLYSGTGFYGKGHGDIKIAE
jgi:hypothetical protein